MLEMSHSELTIDLKIIDSAKKLFWKYGIKKVSVEEICKEAKISKMTFYRNYKNKLEVAKLMLENIAEASLFNYAEIMALEVPFKEKINKIIQFKQESVKGISKEIIRDIHVNYKDELGNLIESYQQKMFYNIVRDFTIAQKEGWIRQDLKIEFILYELNQITQKILDPNLNKLYESEEKLIMDVTNFFFYGVLI